MFEEAMTTGAEIVECQAVELHPDGRPIRFNAVTREGPLDGDAANRALINDSLRHVVWNKIYARSLWNRVPDHADIDIGLSITEDLLRNSLIFPHCRRYSSVRDCLYFYCRRPTSVVKGVIWFGFWKNCGILIFLTPLHQKLKMARAQPL